MTPEELKDHGDNFREKIFYIKDEDLKDKIVQKFIIFVYVSNKTLSEHVTGRTDIGKLLKLELNLFRVSLLVSMMEGILFYLIDQKYKKESRSLLTTISVKYSDEKEYELKSGEILSVAKKKEKEEKNIPTFARMIDFIESKDIFIPELIKDMRTMKDCRNTIHIYDSTKKPINISDTDMELYSNIWGKLFYNIDKIFTKND